jgi:hypothetical protein
MPTQSEIDRMLVLVHRSNNTHDHVNYVAPAGWLDGLPLAGLADLISTLELLTEQARDEAKRRMPNVTLAVCSREK